MKIKELFLNESYTLIDENPHIRINAFMEEPDNDNNYNYEVPLIHIYIHMSKKEMFLVLDCINEDFDRIKQVCKEWESKVMAFINFDEHFDEDIMKYLKYNISLIILCKDDPDSLKDNNFRFETEKSLIICRKIFVLCNDEGDIYENNDIKLPFYFDPIYDIDPEGTSELEKELKALLPREDFMSNNEMDDISYKELLDEVDLDEGDIDKISRWLDNDN